MVLNLKFYIMKKYVLILVMLMLVVVSPLLDNSTKMSDFKKEMKCFTNEVEENASSLLKPFQSKKLAKAVAKFKSKIEIDLATTDYVITKNGSILLFPINSILDDDGNTVSGKVDIEIVELNDRKEFLKSGITTSTVDNKLLVSGGTYYLNYTQKGKKLQINPKNKPLALFPTHKVDKEMKYFKGNVNHQHQDIVWDNQPSKLNARNLPDSNLFRFKTFISDLYRKYRNEISTIEKYYYWEDIVNVVFYDRTYKGRQLRLENGTFVHWGKDYSGKYEATKLLEAEKFVKRTKIEKHEARANMLKDSITYLAINNAMAILNNKEVKSKYYVVAIESLGWLNLDKYLKEDLHEFEGQLAGLDSVGTEAQVHLLCINELIHLKQKTENGKFKITFPVGKPFELIIEHGTKMTTKQFDGKSTDLGIIKV